MKELANSTFKVVSLGCKVNYYECEAIASLLESKGLFRVNEKEKSDITIINTCAVTEEASRKSRQIIRRSIKLTQNVTIVCGCLSQIDDSIKNIPGVNIIFGSKNKAAIYDALINFYNDNNKQLNYVNSDIFHSCFDNLQIDKFESRTRAFLKIQDGCTNFCSYCIIPYARGNSVSKPFKDAIEEAKTLVLNRHKEIVVTGIDTGSYGKDIGTNFYELLKELENIHGLERIRISSLEITELSNEIIDLIKDSKKIVHHIHIPLQSGSNRILKLMNRHYNKEFFIEKVKEIRNKIPNVSITTDFIVGFPTETIEDFNESIETLKILDFQTIHAFPYSLRKGTKAALLPQIEKSIKKERNNIIISISNDGKNRYIEENINTIQDSIFETYENGYIYGHTGNYIYVKAKSDFTMLNKLVKIRLIKNETDAVLSEIL
ncbi:tRNA (N(6)-L-threonylcarbamoyladenosine(37)-C(2))-methylthiotransferase MtaB [bacterium]|nr:tRNA (N(6)-L-threonylcarbamoyladenosine(37)-C(2))-methylthiotransferase MtaB [bacterium]